MIFFEGMFRANKRNPTASIRLLAFQKILQNYFFYSNNQKYPKCIEKIGLSIEGQQYNLSFRRDRISIFSGKDALQISVTSDHLKGETLNAILVYRSNIMRYTNFSDSYWPRSFIHKINTVPLYIIPT